MTFDAFQESFDRGFALAWPIAWAAAYPAVDVPTFREADAIDANLPPPVIVPHLLFSDATVNGQARAFSGLPGRVQVDMWVPPEESVYWAKKMRPTAWTVIKGLEATIPGLHVNSSMGAPRTIETGKGRVVKAADVRLLFTSAEEANS